jgi:hypothetical protein
MSDYPTMTLEEASAEADRTGESVMFIEKGSGKVRSVSPEPEEDEDSADPLHGLKVPDDYEDPEAYPELLDDLRSGGSTQVN